jgi:hypothetical protein
MTAKIDSNKLIEMSTHMIFDRAMAIYLTRRAFGPGKVWNVTNEIGEYLNKDLEFEHAAGQRGSREFKMRTDFDFNTAYQMAGAYVGKTIRERKELNQAGLPIRGPGSSPSNTASQPLED